jgi:hypothetical protein
MMTAARGRVAVCFVAALALCVCERVWHLTVQSVANGQPRFCISRRSDCRGEGVQLKVVIVSEVDSTGAIRARMWSIQPSGDHSDRLEHLTYGIAPQGWVEDSPAAPLQGDTFYSINGQFFFRLSGRQAHVYSLSEFSKMNGAH